MRRAIYAGSFDPFTRGHADIVMQARKIFDKVVIAPGTHPSKTRLFSTADTEHLIHQSIEQRGWKNVIVRSFDGALVDFAEEIGADAIVRGLRQVSDFNDEFTQHGINSRMTDLPLTYFICRQDFLHVSSSSAKELVRYHKDVDWLVDPHVGDALRERLHG